MGEQPSLNDKLCTYMLKLIDQSQWSINRISELADVSQSNLNRILTEHRPLSQLYIEKVCAVLKISCEDFYRGALTSEYTLDELKMHTIIHMMDERTYGPLITLLKNMQMLSPKRRKTN